MAIELTDIYTQRGTRNEMALYYARRQKVSSHPWVFEKQNNVNPEVLQPIRQIFARLFSSRAPTTQVVGASLAPRSGSPQLQFLTSANSAMNIVKEYLKPLGLAEDRSYSEILNTNVKHLVQCGLRSTEDFQVIGITFDLLETMNDIQKNLTGFLHHPGQVENSMNSISVEKNKLREISENTSRVCAKIVIIRQNMADLASPLDPQFKNIEDQLGNFYEQLQRYNTRLDAALIGKFQSILCALNVMEIERLVFLLRSYHQQYGILSAWENLNSQGIDTLEALQRRHNAIKVLWFYELGREF